MCIYKCHAVRVCDLWDSPDVHQVFNTDQSAANQNNGRSFLWPEFGSSVSSASLPSSFVPGLPLVERG